MTKMTIADYAANNGTLRIIPAKGDTSTTTIADLAQFVSFNIDEARTQDTSPWCVAYGELLSAYGQYEMAAGEQDYYDGFFMEFVDGSQLCYTS